LSALAGAAATAATMPASMGMAAQAATAEATTKGVFKASPAGNKRNLLFVTDSPRRYEKLLEAIRAIKEYDITASSVQVNLQTNAGTINPAQIKDADVIVLVMPSAASSAGKVAAAIPPVSSPVIIFPVNFDFIMLEADVAAQFRASGINALLANSEAHLIGLIKTTMAPRILEGKKAVIFGRPFDSSSVPSGGISEDYIYRHTGLRLQYRPIEELQKRLESISDAAAQAEMERWKREATEVTEAADRAILDASRLYHLLRTVIKEEQIDGLSIDCLSFTFANSKILPYPCLTFARLRDEGHTIPCEADVCGMLSSMVMETISKRPSYFCNVSEAKEQTATVVLRHCVAPTKVMGYDAPAAPYRIRDYHGIAGATAEVQFPTNVDVTMGGFSKDLREFVAWPGKIVPRVRDTDAPSFPGSKMRKYCTNHLELKINDMESFIQSIAGCHHIMVTGNYRKPLNDAMMRMNVRMVGPSDFSTPA
jgi:hypothetical protein